MPLTYATYADYNRLLKIAPDSVEISSERVVKDYLRRSTAYIDRLTRRFFYPVFDTRFFAIPATFYDLRLRVQAWEDLTMDQDLLETMFVTTGGQRSSVDTTEDVPGGGLTASQTTFSVTDVAGSDANAKAPRIVLGDQLLIDQELMIVYAITGNTLTVIRGAVGTVAAAHAAGTQINRLNMSHLTRGIDYHLMDFNVEPKYAVRLVWPNTWAGQYGAGSFRYRYPQIYVSGLWGFHANYARDGWIGTSLAVPAGGLTDSATTVTLSDVDALDALGEPAVEEGYLLRIDNELVEVVSANTGTNAVVIRRGAQGSIPMAHAEGAVIRRWNVPPEIREACLSIARIWREADSSSGGRKGVSDMSTGFEISVTKDVAYILGLYRRAFL